MVATIDQQQLQAFNATGTNSSGTRYRTMHKFWLDLCAPLDSLLNDQIAELKRKRMFTQTVRDGIRLIMDLREKNLDVLFGLFPWVEQWMEAEVQRRMAAFARIKPVGQGELEARIAKLEAMLNASTPPVMRPVVDEDEPEITIKKAAPSGNSADQFLKAAFSLIQ